MALPDAFRGLVDAERFDTLEAMFRAARYESVCETAVAGRVYCEVNQTLVYLLPVIRQVFSSARLMLLCRHPGRFIVSAVRLGWYANDTVWEIGRPRFERPERWAELPIIEKLARYWTETNRFALRYIDPAEDVIQLESLFTRVAPLKAKLARIAPVRASDNYLRQLMARRSNAWSEPRLGGANMKREPGFPDWEQLTADQRSAVWDIAGPVAKTLGYEVL
jgi:hypothetical protein